MKILNRSVAYLACFFALLATFGCSPDQTAKMARTIATAADTLAVATPLLRALVEAGELTPVQGASIARGARDLNRLLGEGAAYVLAQPVDATGSAQLSGEARARLADQLLEIIASAERLQADGVLHIKSGRARLTFQVLVSTARLSLQTAQEGLSSTSRLPSAVALPVRASTRIRLLSASDCIARNESALSLVLRDLEERAALSR